jgi:hypothetical protein
LHFFYYKGHNLKKGEEEGEEEEDEFTYRGIRK